MFHFLSFLWLFIPHSVIGEAALCLEQYLVKLFEAFREEVPRKGQAQRVGAVFRCGSWTLEDKELP